MGVADAFHAVMNPRPYREALTTSQAIQELKKATGTQYDSDVVHTLARLVKPVAAGGARPQREIKTS